MTYVKTAWVDDAAPALNAANLNKIEQGIKDAHDLIAAGATGAVVATTIAGLGAASAGKQGVLRMADWTGYELLPVIYDSVLGKWVSARVPIWSSVNPVAGNYGTNNDGGAVWGAAGIDWKPYLTAGLTPQFKFSGMTMDAVSSTNLFLYITQYHTSDYQYPGAVPNDLASIANLLADQRAQATAAVWTGYRGRWIDGTIPGTPKDVLLVAPQTNRATSRIAGTVYCRWVG